MRFIKTAFIVICAAAVVCSFSTCQKAYSVQINTVAAAAAGSLLDSSGNCMDYTTTGTFYDGVTPGSDTAYVTAQVNVTQTGSFTITTDLENGLYFSASGNFTATGINTVRLKPIGRPVQIGATAYTVSFNSSTCNFTLQVNDSTGTGLGGGGTQGGGTTSGTWQFSPSAGDTITSTNATGTLVSSGGVNALSITGTNANGDTSLAIVISLPSSTIPASGQYTASSGNVTLQVTGASGTFIYSAIAVSGVTLTVNITSYSASTKELKGTFSGVVKTTGGSNATLSDGSFDVIVQ